MKAMLFAAGLGTRLRPYTNDRPKALVEVAGQTLLEHNLRRLSAADCEEIIVNVHAFADQMVDFIDANWTRAANPLNGSGEPDASYRAPVRISDERGLLLETGGGLLRAAPYLKGSDFLTHNVDVLSDLDLRSLMRFHREKGGLVTLCVRRRTTSRYLLFDPTSRELCGWRNVRTGEEKPARAYDTGAVTALAYSGIAVYHPRIFDFMRGREGEKFSVVDVWLRAAATESLYAYPHDHSRWIDVGRPESLKKAENIW